MFNQAPHAVARFHPLKAGRRPLISFPKNSPRIGFHPLKAGRRLPRRRDPPHKPKSFHPLKAGRRPRNR